MTYLKKLSPILSLYGSDLTDERLKGVAQLPSLTSLSLSGDKVTDAGLKELAPLTRLTELGLYGTKVTDAGLKYLAPLKNLISLGVDYLPITDKGLPELARLTNLRFGVRQPPPLATAGRWKWRVGDGWSVPVGVAHAANPWRPRGQHQVKQAETAKNGNAWRHQPFAARLVAGEMSAVEHGDVMPGSAQDKGGGRTTGPRSDHDGARLGQLTSASSLALGHTQRARPRCPTRRRPCSASIGATRRQLAIGD